MTRNRVLFAFIALLVSPSLVLCQAGSGKPPVIPKPTVPVDFVVFFTPHQPSGGTDDVITFATKDIRLPAKRNDKSAATPLMDCTKIDETTDYQITDVATLLTCASGDKNLLTGEVTNSLNLSIDKRAVAAAATLRTVLRYADEGSTRIDGRKNTKVLAAALTSATLTAVGAEPIEVVGPVTEFSFSDEEQDTQLSTDLEHLVSIAFSLATTKSGGEPPVGELDTRPVIWLQYKPHTLKYTRDKVRIDETFKSSARLGSEYEAVKLDKWAVRMANQGITDIKENCKKIADGLDPGDSVALFTQSQSPLAIAICVIEDDPALTEANTAASAKAEADKGFESATLEARAKAEVEAKQAAASYAAAKVKADAEGEVRASAAASLGRLQSDQAALVLRSLLNDAKYPPVVRIAAGKALIPEGQNRAVGQPLDAGRKDPAISTTLLSGPADHWYLSANVLVTPDISVSQNDQGQLQLDEKPPDFYIGGNFLIGDLRTPERRWFESIVFQGFVKGSKRPQESHGIGIGYRGRLGGWPVVDFETFSPFIAITRTRHEQNDVVTFTREVRFGISVNLDKALDWLKTDDQKK